MKDDAVLRASGLVKHYAERRHVGEMIAGTPAAAVRAVDGIDLAVGAAETVAVVGESGAGKTTLVRSILVLERPTAGSVFLHGRDLLRLSASELRRARRDMQAVFQDPASSLNPRQRVDEIVTRPLRTHGIASRRERSAAAAELLDLVELRPSDGNRFPHQFSLGQRQRIAIARALAVRPSVIVADEPVSALDVSVQAQILSLLQRLQTEFKVSYLLVSHDLRVVRHLSHRIYVVYAGVVVEEGGVADVFERPHHPYTQALLASVPRIGVPPSPPPQGEPASPRTVPTACRFRSRCPFAIDQCHVAEPALIEVGPGHFSRCVVPLEARRGMGSSSRNQLDRVSAKGERV